MNVYNDVSEIKHDVNTVVTIGTFDELHLAHRQILDKVTEIAKQNNSRSFIVTFEPHPQEVLKNKTPDIRLLTAIDETEAFRKSRHRKCSCYEIHRRVFQTDAKEFYHRYFGGIGFSDLVIGYDHLFGRNREGSIETLKSLGGELGFKIHRVEEIDIELKPVSSTRIRAALAAGEVEEAARLLGYEYGFDGVVVEGDKVGRTIGYPTVNLKMVKENKVMPAEGIYCVRVIHDGKEYYARCTMDSAPH